MKTYTATYQLESPKTQKIWVPQFSDYKIGIAVTRGGEDAEGTLVVKDGSTTLSADAEKTSIWTTYALKSQAPGYSELSIEWEDSEVSSNTAVFKLIRAVTDSSTLETGGEGGGSAVELTAGANLSADGLEVGMLGSIELETAKAERISADMLSGIAVRGGSGTFTDITCSNQANIAYVTSPYVVVGDGATAGTLDASNSTATFCEKDTVHDPNADIVVKKYNSTSQQYDSYSLGVHTLSGTYDDEGTEVQFVWKILANAVS